MEVGNNQEPLLGPVQRTARIGEKWNSGEHNEIALALCQILRRLRQLIASLINSSAASANSVSEASP